MREHNAKEMLLAFAEMPDEAIVWEAKNNANDLAQDYLVRKYTPVAEVYARKLFLLGGDEQDLIQEGRIGICNAISNFCPDKEVAFSSFVRTCIKRRMFSAVRAYGRQKHGPLNNYVSINMLVSTEDEAADRPIIEVMQNEIRLLDPEELCISKEECLAVERDMAAILSTFEWQVLRLYLQELSFAQIASSLQRPLKSVYNAMQRIKQKVENYLQSSENKVNFKSLYHWLLALNVAPQK